MIGSVIRGFASLCIAFAPAQDAAAGPGALPAAVEQALQRAHVPADALVVVVQDAGAPTPLLSWQASLPVNPASLMKLLTTYAALDLLGPSWTWNTPVWLHGRIEDGVLDGDLVIKGSGDPKLVMERMWLLLRRVQQLGVREIRGDIVLDRSAFSVPDVSPGDFDGEPLRPYNVQPDALLLNYKSVLLTFTPDVLLGRAIVAAEPPLGGVMVDASVALSSVACDDWRAALQADFSEASRIRFLGGYPAVCGEKRWVLAYVDPRTYNTRAIAGLWAEMGGHLRGIVRDGAAPLLVKPNFEITSPTLGETVRDINKFSNNLMAQQLFLTLGLVARNQGSPEAAREVLHQWVANRLGDASGEIVIDNGSGLSRDSRMSAHTLARLLLHAWSSPVMPELASSLPVTGLDGTLRRSRAQQGRAHLKTGSLRDVAGIAGYVLGNSGRRYVLVAVINHPNANAGRAALDALVQWTTFDDAMNNGVSPAATANRP
jgi:serine-type D-Ala-D-Ala carboxypeptidase/endopeptidase (penicillin-binding protein 4)